MLTVGVDLDLTLLDTRRATAVALAYANEVCGVSIDVDAFVREMGPPLHEALRRWVPEERMERAIAAYRSCLVGPALCHLNALPGALELAAAAATSGRRLVVITSKRPEIAAAFLAAGRLAIASLVGNVTGEEKTAAMRREGVEVYLGDHPLDMAAAAGAGVPGWGVLTGNHTEAELYAAGASTVHPTLLAARPHLGW